MHEFTQAYELRSPIRVGTSGWSYEDWVGSFYQTTERQKWLDFYANFFKTVEINSTYYRVSGQKLVDIWIQKALKHEGFEYSLKFPRFYELDDLDTLATEFENTVVFPLHQNNLLGAILVQLTPYVKRIEHGYRTGNLEKLALFLNKLSTDDYTYFVEFRHASWLDNTRQDLEPGTRDTLAQHNVGLCIVDGPSFPTVLSEATRKTDSAYVRLHGRNVEEWFKRHRSDASLSKRYDYVYTEEELIPWKDRITKLETELGGKRRIWIYFNNHPRANAPRNALMLMKLLEITKPENAEDTLQSTSPTTLGDWASRS